MKKSKKFRFVKIKSRGKQKKFILTFLMIISLTTFNFSVFPTFAEESGDPTQQGIGAVNDGNGNSESAGAAEETENSQNDSLGSESAAGNDETESNLENGDNLANNDSAVNPAAEEENNSQAESGDLAAADGSDTAIETGDADIQIEDENQVNANIVNLEENNLSAENPDNGTSAAGAENETLAAPEENNEQDAQGAAVLPEPAEPAEPASEAILEAERAEGCENECGQNCACDCKANNINKNKAVVENNIEANGISGENAIENNLGGSLINTGDVNIALGIVNTVNSNLINSEFSLSLLNIFEKLGADINVENVFDPFSAKICSETAIGCLDVNNENSGEIKNNVSINGSSGGNTAQSENGDAVIKTGDVNAAASIFNLLNTNLVGSNWRNFIINIFDDWVGDLIFPGKAKMQEFLKSSQNNGCGENCGISVNNSNESRIENNVSAQSDTGGNEALGNSATANTGEAKAKTNILNVANTNVTGGSWFLLAINNFGKWQGTLYSLPEELGIAEDDDGVKIYKLDPENFNNEETAPDSNSQNFDEPASAPESESGEALNVTNDNSGVIRNNIALNASTGGNSANAAGGQAVIATGNANVSANLVNVLNSNIINNNLLLGMVNVFGNWNGNLVFGRPDLWIGESAAVSSNPVGPGGKITYTLTYANKGDADATGVIIIDDFDERYLSIVNPVDGVVSGNPGEIQWNIGTVLAGGTGSVSYSVSVGAEIPYGATSLTNQAAISSFETDQNIQDNSEIFLTEAYRSFPVLYSSCFWNPPPPPPNLQIAETHSGEGIVYGGDYVDYKITLTNQSERSAYNVLVSSALFDGSDNAVNASSWDLGEVFPNEEITIDYTLEIGSEIPAGFYTNAVQAEGFDFYGDSVKSLKIVSAIEVRVKEEVKEKAEEEVKEEIKEEAVVMEEAAQEISPETDKNVGNPEKQAPSVLRKTSLVKKEATIANSVKEVLGAEASAAEEADFLKTGIEEKNIAPAGGFLDYIKHKYALAIFIFSVILLIGVFVLSNRRKCEKI